MSAFRAFLFVIAVIVVGLVAYQIGVSQAVVTTLPAGAAPVAYYPYPHWGFGFGFLGLLFPLLFFFLIIAAMGAAFRGARGGYGGRGWGDGRSRIEQLHRELHGEKPSGDRPTSTST